MIICDIRKSVLDTCGHTLVEGGPGAGKTTLALLKAKVIIENELLLKNQKILFLSFARATISRIEEQAKDLLVSSEKKGLEINTYHGFTWSIIKSYCYLLKNHRQFKLITPPIYAASKAGIKNQDEIDNHKYQLLTEGIICFELFAELVTELLERSIKIRSLLSDKYPYIIVDEFQDTDSNEWNIIKLLGQKSKIIALADLNQRIFEFRGATIKRIPEFNKHFSPLRVDLGKENNRSKGKDIVQFGDDLLTGRNKGKMYNNVHINYYNYNKKDLRFPLFIELQRAFKRKEMLGDNRSWSLAILVKSKLDTLKISTYLTSKKINHEVIIDPEGPALAATLIAKIMEPITNWDISTFIDRLLLHLKGRKSNKISKVDMNIIDFLESYEKGNKIVGSKRKQLIDDIELIIAERQKLNFTGSPDKDWILVRNLFQKARHEVLKTVYDDALYIKLLKKGAILLEKLIENWRKFQCYHSASKLVEDALIKEHFAMNSRTYSGIFVMNLHKSKGKEFDEVIIWEELYSPIVSMESSRIEQDKLVLRVALTRARSYATMLTPASRPCILL